MAVKQKVFLEVWDAPDGGNLILASNGLRVDFDIRHIPEFSRATFTIYNLNNKTITSLMNGGRYVTLKTQLHDGKVELLANRFFVNNAIDELVLPNRITKLFCFDRLRSTFLEQQVSIPVGNYPSLKDMIDALGIHTKYGTAQDTDFKSFPTGVVYQKNKKPTRVMNGSAQQVLSKLEREYGFETYTDNGRFKYMYKPDEGNVAKTSLATKEPDVILTTRAMRSNPKIGIATCSIHSNLDGRITPTSVIDLSRLLTATADANEDTLQLVENFLKNFSSNSKYQAFAVQHTGSNYTADWSTRISGISPTRGSLMPTINWAGRTN